MKKIVYFIAFIGAMVLFAADEMPQPEPQQMTPSTQTAMHSHENVSMEPQVIEPESEVTEQTLEVDQTIQITVTGQGVAPMNTSSPAQAYALAKRAAVADGYRLIAERVKGVRVDGQDLIQNMMVKRSSVRTSVNAMVKNANVVETVFRDGLCEVEMEITISYSDFAQ